MSKIIDIKANDWRDYGNHAIASYRHYVQDSKYFRYRAYSPWYARKKAASKAAHKGVPQSSTSTVPDLTLTGRMMQGLSILQVGSSSVDVGWVGEEADKVHGNAAKGRDLQDQKLLDKIHDDIYPYMDNLIDKSIDNWASRDVNIRV